MKKTLVLTILALLACLITCSSVRMKPGLSASQDKADEAAVNRYLQALESNANDHAATDGLKRLIDRPNPVSDRLDRRVREILRQYARVEKISLVNDDEPGEKLSVKGTVRSLEGEPVAAAVIYVFQTDALGHYTRASVMNEPKARLFGYLKTDKHGHFEFSTIRPGGYPGRADRQGEQWRIPEHIHFQITAPGHQFRNFQMVFADDPRMTPYWHDWAKRGNQVVVKVTLTNVGSKEAVCDVVLQPQ